MGKVNAGWHKFHVVPKNPTDHHRAEWHFEHALHCRCREITPSIAMLLKANGFTIPKAQAAIR